jgi:uncharacterized protein (DUF2384 family)
MEDTRKNIKQHFEAKLQETLEVLKEADSENLETLASKAAEVFGSNEKAYEWMFASIYSLKGRRPVTCTNSEKDLEWALQVLDSIEHGIPP